MSSDLVVDDHTLDEALGQQAAAVLPQLQGAEAAQILTLRERLL